MKRSIWSVGFCVCLGLSVFALGVFELRAAEHHGQVTFAGVAVPGAKVTATQGDKKLTAVTDMDGVYSFPDLADGTWSIQVEMSGFTPEKQDVTASAMPVFEMKMLGLEAMNATVQAAPLRTEVRPANTATPTPVKPAAPKPGAAKPPAQTAAAAPAEAAPTDEAQSRAADGFLINGSSNNGASSPFALNPAFGNNRRGGRSLYNGSIGLNLGNSVLDARPFSLTGQNTEKPTTSRLVGLFNFGGPVKIPRLLPRNGPNFTVNYQWTRSRNGTTQTGLLPTDAQRAGDLSSITTPVLDPLTGKQFAGNQIPLNRISPQAVSLQALYPTPNFTSSIYNYQIPVINVNHADAVSLRMNKGVGRKNQLSWQFQMQDSRGDNPNLLGFLDTNRSLGFNANFVWRRTFTPRFYGNFSYTFSRQSISQNSFFANRANISGTAGITGNNQDPVNYGPPGLGFTSGISGLNDGNYSRTHNQTGNAAYDSTWNHGRHAVAFGADLRRLELNTFGQQNPRGSFQFLGGLTGGPTTDYAGFLLGIPDTATIAFGNADKYLRGYGADLYLNDDWRVNPSLTLNMVIRWQYNSPFYEKYGRLVNLDVGPGFASVKPVVATDPTGPITGMRYPDSLVNTDKHGFVPKFGLAWRPISGSSLIIRAGYDLNWDTSGYSTIAQQMLQQSPLSKSLRVSNSAAVPLTLANGFIGSPTDTPQTFAVDPNFRLGYVQNWQLIVQKDLPFSLQMVATYNGTKGTRAMQQFYPNTYPFGGVNPCNGCPSGFTYMTSNGNSTREAGIFQLRRRLRSGFTATLQYTYAKAIDDAALGGAGSGSVIAQDWHNLSGERGLSNFDQRHQLSFQTQYTTGLGLGGGTLLTGWKAALYKEWTFATQVNAATGRPLSPLYSAPIGGASGPLRPNYTGLPLYDTTDGRFLNPLAYVAPVAGEYGNAGRDSITGPGQFGMSATMARTFRMSDRLNLTFTLNASNVLNHVVFSSWNTTLGNQQFGLPQNGSANQMRQIQTTLRLNF
ncbi:MAG TPA: carboxypeptidase regulatory-like domain-containing protein [Bryobacteraceae bacterium]